MKLGTQTRYLLTALLLAALAFGGGVWMNRDRSADHKDAVELVPDLSCDLRAGPCQLPLPGGGVVKLGIQPRELPPMAPLRLEVELEGASYQAKWVDFVGPEMDMGFNRSSLEASEPGRFGGSGLIPVCVSDRMLWEARVMLTDGDDWISAPFRFEVIR